MRRGMLAAFAVVGVHVCAAACQPTDFTFAAAADGGPPVVGSGPDSATDGPTIVNGIPAGWRGPGIFLDRETTELPDCPNGYDAAFNGTSVPEYLCTPCTCTTDFSGCSTAHFAVGGGCDSLTRSLDLALGACGMETPLISAVKRVNCGAACTSTTASVSGDVSWKKAQRLCLAGPSADVSSADASSDHGECIWQNVDVDAKCPPPTESRYGVRYAIFAGFNQHSGCSECTCTPGSCGPAKFTGHGNPYPTCGGTNVSVTVGCEECVPTTFGGTSDKSVDWTDPGVRQECAPGGGAPTGKLERLETMVVCCTK